MPSGRHESSLLFLLKNKTKTKPLCGTEIVRKDLHEKIFLGDWILPETSAFLQVLNQAARGWGGQERQRCWVCLADYPSGTETSQNVKKRERISLQKVWFTWNFQNTMMFSKQAALVWGSEMEMTENKTNINTDTRENTFQVTQLQDKNSTCKRLKHYLLTEER